LFHTSQIIYKKDTIFVELLEKWMNVLCELNVPDAKQFWMDLSRDIEGGAEPRRRRTTRAKVRRDQ
jgi:hypothetical protein